MPGTVLLLAASPMGKGCLVDAASVLPVLAAVPPPVLAGTDTANVVELADPLEPQAVLTRLRAAAVTPGPLTLFVAGQLQLDRRQRLPHLALARTTAATVRYTAFPWHWFREELRLRAPGSTTVVLDLRADPETWGWLRGNVLDCGTAVAVYGRIAPPPGRRAVAAPSYMKAVATILRSGGRPAVERLHQAALARIAGEGEVGDLVFSPSTAPMTASAPMSASPPMAPPAPITAFAPVIPSAPATSPGPVASAVPVPVPVPVPASATSPVPLPATSPAPVVSAVPAARAVSGASGVPAASAIPVVYVSPPAALPPAPGAPAIPGAPALSVVPAVPAGVSVPSGVPSVPGASDPHAALSTAVRAGRHGEADVLAARLEQDAVAELGPGSEEALHWAEVRADLAMFAGDAERSCRTWMAVAVARLEVGQPVDAPAVEAAVDRAHHQWGRITDAPRARALGQAIAELRARVPGRHEGALDHVQQQLRQLQTQG
ncbi:hypothetical protein OHS71_20530 [Streptomyces sp. NBC_00377]|uniref:hypothetical protein n=1 Tax=unclassified Streptomyces TaxID=2593676 RepID=UPI002E216F7F|nr:MULTISPECIES: hypothetical protein [unclassified Streptomyces]